MRIRPNSIQSKITASLLTTLILLTIALASDFGEKLQGKGILIKLFVMFTGAIIVGSIMAILVIPGLISVKTMIKGLTSLTRRERAKQEK